MPAQVPWDAGTRPQLKALRTGEALWIAVVMPRMRWGPKAAQSCGAQGDRPFAACAARHAPALRRLMHAANRRSGQVQAQAREGPQHAAMATAAAAPGVVASAVPHPPLELDKGGGVKVGRRRSTGSPCAHGAGADATRKQQCLCLCLHAGTCGLFP